MDQYYYYAACIIIISVFSLCIGVRQIYKNQRALRNTAIGKVCNHLRDKHLNVCVVILLYRLRSVLQLDICTVISIDNEQVFFL